jgi:hypothetical protein
MVVFAINGHLDESFVNGLTKVVDDLVVLNKISFQNPSFRNWIVFIHFHATLFRFFEVFLPQLCESHTLGHDEGIRFEQFLLRCEVFTRRELADNSKRRKRRARAARKHLQVELHEHITA